MLLAGFRLRRERMSWAGSGRGAFSKPGGPRVSDAVLCEPGLRLPIGADGNRKCA